MRAASPAMSPPGLISGNSGKKSWTSGIAQSWVTILQRMVRSISKAPRGSLIDSPPQKYAINVIFACAIQRVRDRLEETEDDFQYHLRHRPTSLLALLARQSSRRRRNPPYQTLCMQAHCIIKIDASPQSFSSRILRIATRHQFAPCHVSWRGSQSRFRLHAASDMRFQVNDRLSMDGLEGQVWGRVVLASICTDVECVSEMASW